jgi:hypothetical protein
VATGSSIAVRRLVFFVRRDGAINKVPLFLRAILETLVVYHDEASNIHFARTALKEEMQAIVFAELPAFR